MTARGMPWWRSSNSISARGWSDSTMMQKRRLPDFRTWSTPEAMRSAPVHPQGHGAPRESLQHSLAIRADDPGKSHPRPPPSLWTPRRRPRPTIRHKSPPPQPPSSRQRQSSHSAQMPALCPFDLVTQPRKMALDVLQGIELEQGLALIRGEGDAVRHAHVRRDDEGRAASARGMAPETVQPSEFGVAEPAEGKAAVEVRADAIGLEKLPVGIEPLNHPPHICGLDEPGPGCRRRGWARPRRR